MSQYDPKETAEKTKVFLDSLIEQTIADERERCAMCAENIGLSFIGAHINQNDLRQIQRQIAAAIRNTDQQ